MTTTAMGINRIDYHQDATVAVGGAITPDVQLTFEDALSREEIVLAIEKLKSRLLEIDYPVV